MQKFVEKRKVNFALKDKQLVTRAAVNFCAKDVRPFNAIQCTGLGELLYDVSVIANKYGKMSKESFMDLLPVPNTV